MALGTFDEELRLTAWLEDEEVIEGWFDPELIAAQVSGTDHNLICQNGTYAIAGQSATIARDRSLAASSGSYAYSGQSATLLRSKLVSALNGTYPITGQSATLTYTPGATNYELISQHGVYSITGQSVSLNRNSSLTASSGSYSVTGQNATLLRSKAIEAVSGTYSITGQSANLEKSGTPNDYNLICLNGSYRTGGNYVDPGYWGEGYVVGTVIEVSRLRVGGDDVPGKHTGWNKKSWQKKHKQEEAIEETIRDTYQKMMGIAPSVEVVESVAQELKKESPPAALKPVTFDYSGVAEWLQAHEKIVAQIIAKRQQDEDDDEEAILLLL